MVTNKTFYTDSNGRDFIKRVCRFHAIINKYKTLNMLVHVHHDAMSGCQLELLLKFLYMSSCPNIPALVVFN